uniref:Uncharacterized protein n=1 Tax=Arundo donax TaxID=35708 RepID=A0A0A8Z5F4_ARUDO
MRQNCSHFSSKTRLRINCIC